MVLRKIIIFLMVGCLCLNAVASSDKNPAGSSAYLSGDKVLNSEMGWKPSPKVAFSFVDFGYAKDCISAVPSPGIHPRILMSPEDIPDVRKRLARTHTGKRLLQTARDHRR